MKPYIAFASVLAMVVVRSIGGETINVELSGAYQLPPITTDVTGNATITYVPSTGSTSSTINFTIALDNPTGIGLFGGGSHLHCAPVGSDGSVIALLVPDGADISATVSTGGTVTYANLRNTSCGDTIDTVYASMMSGNVYVNVHSTEHPYGEVRGQIVISSGTSPTGSPVAAPVSRAPVAAPTGRSPTRSPVAAPTKSKSAASVLPFSSGRLASFMAVLAAYGLASAF
jgi:CHRD domain